MQVGLIGAGRMGRGMAHRWIAAGHEVVVHDHDPEAAASIPGATVARTIDGLLEALRTPRAIWVMVPTAVVDTVIGSLGALTTDDVLIDGGNSFYGDDIVRSARLAERGVVYVDVGTSGGVYGERRGYCLMIGGPKAAVDRLEPLFAALAPGVDAAPRTPGREGPPSTAERGYLHCGPSGAGHFVKMVHNGIEYGAMQALAEGLNVLARAGCGAEDADVDAETTPLRHPERYRYAMDLAAITEVWRRGSVIGSWLLDLTAGALAHDPTLERFEGRVSDSGEGRWTLEAAIDEGVPTPVLAAALHARFASRGNARVADQALAAMRYAFGGHEEKVTS
ncbi:MAG: phosphogluconate dehydrogenase (NAD(+)-dependent, decarboxylating) [Sandaracinaceae bacterium]